MASKKKSAAAKPEPKPEPKQKTVKRKRPFVKFLVYGLAIFFLFPVAVNGVRYIGGKAVDYYRFMLMPKKIIPDILPDFKKEDGRKDRGINWSFASSYDSVGKWVEGNIPSGADAATVKALADCFYDAADAVIDKETPTPGRSLAFLKKKILLAADESWEDFFKGLTNEVAGQEIGSMDEVAALYEVIGNAFSDASKKLKGGAE